MKNKIMIVKIIAAFIVLFFAGCDSQSQRPGETQTEDVSPTHSPVDAPAPVLTSTQRSTETHSPTPTPNQEHKELQAFVLEMLNSNGGCELPCWWGIVPGETSWEEMKNYFNAQGIAGAENGYLDLSYMDPEYSYRISLLEVMMEQQDGVVHNISVVSDYYAHPLDYDFTLNWQRYELSQVLARHGIPSQVYLSLAVGSPCIGPGIVPTYDMWVEYEDLGMAVLYSGILIRDLDNWLLCPVFGQTTDIFGPRRAIEIRLQSPDLDTPIFDVQPGDGEFIFTGTLEELANMSMGEFFEMFSEPDPQSCALLDTTPRASSSYIENALPTGFSIMTPEEEDAFLVDMLANDEDCELPCWWGITPGVTSWQDAQQIFLSYGKDIDTRQHLASYRDEEGNYISSYEGFAHHVGLFGRHAQYPFDYVLKHTFFEQGDTVQLIEVIGHALEGYSWYTPGWDSSPLFSQDWHRYTLDQILSRYGKPSQVLLHYWPHNGALFSVAVLYEDEGMMFAYMGGVIGKAEENNYQLGTVVICPTSERISDINIWLKSPDLDDTLEQIYNNWRLGEGYYTLPFSENRSPTLEEAAGLSLDEFYSTFLDPNTDTCIYAQGDLSDMFP